MDNFVQIRGVSFARGDHWVFRDVDINIPKGKVVAVMGPSGSGKTTLLRLISAQLYPQKGEILVKGTDVHSLNQSKLYQLRNCMGMLFQSGALFTNINVF
jgi:phospholipid/cholesterol/gamma-HCH transport system ATP-binding protein